MTENNFGNDMLAAQGICVDPLEDACTLHFLPSTEAEEGCWKTNLSSIKLREIVDRIKQRTSDLINL
jgi:hypothetical protein